MTVHCESLRTGDIASSTASRWSGASSGNRQDDIARLTQAITTAIEGWVRERPEQWLWMHRRWKTQPRPAEEPAPSPAPAAEAQA